MASPEPPRRIALAESSSRRGWVATILMVFVGFPAYLAWALSSTPGTHYGLPVFALLGALAAFFAIRSTRPPEVTVGQDALVIHAGVKTTTLPLDRVVRVVGTEGRLEVQLVGNEKQSFFAEMNLSEARLAELAEWVEEAKQARAHAAAPAHASRLGRRGRPLSAWREELRQLTAETADYRHATLSRDDLAAVLESPKTSPEQRIGAALALAEAGHAEDLERVRIAASACATPRVRIALEAIADAREDEEALAAALEDEPRGRRRRV